MPVCLSYEVAGVLNSNLYFHWFSAPLLPDKRCCMCSSSFPSLFLIFWVTNYSLKPLYIYNSSAITSWLSRSSSSCTITFYMHQTQSMSFSHVHLVSASTTTALRWNDCFVCLELLRYSRTSISVQRNWRSPPLLYRGLQSFVHKSYVKSRFIFRK